MKRRSPVNIASWPAVTLLMTMKGEFELFQLARSNGRPRRFWYIFYLRILRRTTTTGNQDQDDTPLVTVLKSRPDIRACVNTSCQDSLPGCVRTAPKTKTKAAANNKQQQSTTQSIRKLGTIQRTLTDFCFITTVERHEAAP